MNNLKSMLCGVVIAFWAVVPSLAEQLSDSRNLQESIAFDGSGSQRLIVDNVWGSIVVEGYGGETIEMTAVETVRARTQERIDQARDEVAIQVLTREGEIELYVDGPFRCPEREERGNCWNRWHDRYEVIYDFRVRVPHGADPFLRNIDRQYLRPQGDD